MDERSGEIGMDEAISSFVGICQGTSGHFAPDTHMVEFALLGAQTQASLSLRLSL
jgi:hypothetical protein